LRGWSSCASFGIDRERQQAIPASAFDRIAREALKISAQHFAEAVAPRRHALLTAAALSLETGLTDATLLMFDKLMGSLSRKAERRSQEKAVESAHDLQEKLRALTGACTAMIRARENRDDPFIASRAEAAQTLGQAPIGRFFAAFGGGIDWASVGEVVKVSWPGHAGRPGSQHHRLPRAQQVAR
jgi:hypothetical protein